MDIFIWPDIVVIGEISPPVRFAQAFGKAVNRRLGVLVEGLRLLSAFDVARRRVGCCRPNELFYLTEGSWVLALCLKKEAGDS
jgi:hypothetical protein